MRVRAWCYIVFEHNMDNKACTMYIVQFGTVRFHVGNQRPDKYKMMDNG